MSGNFRAWMAIAAALAACSDGAIAADGDLSVFLTPRFENVVTNAAVKFAEVADYRGKPQDLFVDIYKPAGDNATNRPVAVLIHGGGFRTSGKRTQKYIVYFANELAKRGFVAASIDYRQREGDDMPTAADELPALKDAAADTLTALQWIRAHGKDYGYDPQKIFLVGGSAGGRIACAIACRETGDTGGLPESDKFSTTDPPSSVSSEKSAQYSRDGLVAAAVLWGGPEPEYRCFKVDGADLPCVFIHGTYDSLVPAEGSVSLHGKLAGAGVSSRLHLLNGYEHSLKETAAADADAKPRSAQWIADFFKQEWQRKTSGGRSRDPIPSIKLERGDRLALSAPAVCEGFEPEWQWKRDGQVIAGATTSRFVVENVSVADSGLYELTVANPDGAWSVNKVASVTVDAVPVSKVDFRAAGDDGKRTHPALLTVPVALVSVGAE